MFLGGVLKNVYLPIRSGLFPVNTGLMGNAIGGIGALFGDHSLAASQQQHLYQLQQQGMLLGVLDTAKAVYYPAPIPVEPSWLDSKINRVRKLGRDWMQFGAFRTKSVTESKFPPAVGGRPISLYDDYNNNPLASYTRVLKNGDEIKVYPKASDFYGTTNSTDLKYGTLGYNGF